MDTGKEESLESASLNIPIDSLGSQQHTIFTWIERLINGDARVQEDLYRYVYRKLYPVAYRYVNNHDDAIEIFNSAMVKVFKHIETLDDFERVENWIKKIIINTALDFLRVNKKYKNQTQSIDSELKAMPDNHSTDGLHDYDYLLNIVNLLPGRKREVFLLYAIEGYSHREIAEALHISESNSKLLLHEARKFLQKKLLEKDGDETRF